MKPQDIEAGVKKHAPWFYEFRLPGGIITPSALPPEVRPIHETRLAMLETAVQNFAGPKLAEMTALDVGSHEGYFSVALARKGLKQVVGVEPRAESLAKAIFISDALGLNNVSWRQGACETLGEPQTQFDITLFLGVLYHLENPMLAVRNVADRTAGMCLLETQVIDETPGETEWGYREWKQPYHGTFAVISEENDLDRGSREAGLSRLSFCPSPAAVEFMLKTAGFRKVEILPPPANCYEQHQRRKRLMFGAYK